MAEQQMKLVRISLSALMRVTHDEVVAVPVDATEKDLDDLVEHRYAEVDGGDYISDSDYWSRGTCVHKSETEGITPSLSFNWDVNGQLGCFEPDDSGKTMGVRDE